MVAGKNDSQTGVIGPTPILFVSVGPCAEKTLGMLSQMAKGMETPAQGPFGLLSLDPRDQEIVASHWTWLSDFKAPSLVDVRGLPADIADSEEHLLTAVSTLVRQLRSKEPVVDPASPGRVHMSSYILVDLSVADAVASGLRLMRIVRRADPGHDMALVGLTARTAASASAPDEEAWSGRWKQFLEQLQGEPLAQKTYLLDGHSASGTWFDRPEQLHRLGAEFLLHHGILSRGPLRQAERRRVSPNENVLNICGSFGTRAIPMDLPGVATRVARRLAREELGDLYTPVLSKDRRQHLEDGAQALVEKMADVYDRPRRTASSALNTTAGRARDCALRNEDASEAIGKTINHVCAHDPLVSLCHFLKCLRPRLRRLLTRSRLMERERTRNFVAKALRRQEEHTYAPMRVWLSRPGAQWADRFTPTDGPPSSVSVSRAPSGAAYYAGLVFMMVGLVSITSGLLVQERVFVLGGALLALASSFLMTLPVGWTSQSRSKVPEGRHIPDSVPWVSYRRRAGLVRRCAAVVLAAAGVIAVVWSLWPGAWAPTMMFPAGLAALIALIGVGILLGGAVQLRPDQVKEREAPGHLCPPIWTWRVAGLLSLALGWAVLCLSAPAPVRADTVVQWICHFGGIAALVAALVLGLRPGAGRVRLIDRIPKVPEPLVGGITDPAADSDLIREAGAVVQWIERLTLDPDECLLRSDVGQGPQSHEVLFDLLATDWERQLAEVFRKTLHSRTGKSLGDLAREPKLWAQCVVKQLQDPSTECADPAVQFVLEAVQAWMSSLTLTRLVAHLDVDLTRFGHLAARTVSPNWPATRIEPDVSVQVIVVGPSLWEALKPLLQRKDTPAVIELDRNAQEDGILVLRLVQGMTRGWRGFPAMPGQSQESRPADPAHSG